MCAKTLPDTHLCRGARRRLSSDVLRRSTWRLFTRPPLRSRPAPFPRNRLEIELLRGFTLRSRPTTNVASNKLENSQRRALINNESLNELVSASDDGVKHVRASYGVLMVHSSRWQARSVSGVE